MTSRRGASTSTSGARGVDTGRNPPEVFACGDRGACHVGRQRWRGDGGEVALPTANKRLQEPEKVREAWWGGDPSHGLAPSAPAVAAQPAYRPPRPGTRRGWSDPHHRVCKRGPRDDHSVAGGRHCAGQGRGGPPASGKRWRSRRDVLTLRLDRGTEVPRPSGSVTRRSNRKRAGTVGPAHTLQRGSRSAVRPQRFGAAVGHRPDHDQAGASSRSADVRDAVGAGRTSTSRAFKTTWTARIVVRRHPMAAGEGPRAAMSAAGWFRPSRSAGARIVGMLSGSRDIVPRLGE